MTTITTNILRDAIAGGDRVALASFAGTLHASEWAGLTHQLDDDELVQLLTLLPDDTATALLAEIDPADAADLLRNASPGRTASVLAAMEPDDATDVVAEMDDALAGRVLAALPDEDSETIRVLLAYPDGTAGGLMTPEFVAIAPDLTATQAIVALRAIAAMNDHVAHVYVLDREEYLLGALSLRRLVLAAAGTLVRDLMVTPALAVRVDSDAIAAAELLRDRNLLALPVIDDANRLVGVISHDDALETLERQLEDDYFKLAGTDADEMARRTPAQIARLRLPWLFGTMGLELIAGVVIHRFDDVLRQVILLASFMPVISAISGNVGLQAAAIVVRGLDTGHVTIAGWRRHLGRELRTTLFLALGCGVVLGAIGAVWANHLPFGIVIGASLSVSMLTASLMGTVIPMVSKRLGFDPATTAGPFETAFQDVIGFGVFLWLASMLVDVIS